MTPHFPLAELTITSTGLANQPHDARHLQNLLITAWQMENVRRLLGDKPIEITSGYRNPTVNRVVGGVSNSDHALGYAVDFKLSHMSEYDACKLIEKSCIVYHQLILERNGSIIHLSFNPKLDRKSMTQKGAAGSAFQIGIIK